MSLLFTGLLAAPKREVPVGAVEVAVFAASPNEKTGFAADRKIRNKKY